MCARKRGIHKLRLGFLIICPLILFTIWIGALQIGSVALAQTGAAAVPPAEQPVALTAPQPRIGGPGFATQQLFGSGLDISIGLAAGDLNGDGTLDLVTVNSTLPISAVEIPFNTQNLIAFNDPAQPGRFPSQYLRSFGHPDEESLSTVLADMNGDGALDIIVGNGSVNFSAQRALGGQNYVYLNNGGGQFFAGQSASEGEQLVDCTSLPTNVGCFGNPQDITLAVAVADVNGDGQLDIVSQNIIDLLTLRATIDTLRETLTALDENAQGSLATMMLNYFFHRAGGIGANPFADAERFPNGDLLAVGFDHLLLRLNLLNVGQTNPPTDLSEAHLLSVAIDYFLFQIGWLETDPLDAFSASLGDSFNTSLQLHLNQGTSSDALEFGSSQTVFSSTALITTTVNAELQQAVAAIVGDEKGLPLLSKMPQIIELIKAYNGDILTFAAEMDLPLSLALADLDKAAAPTETVGLSLGAPDIIAGHGRLVITGTVVTTKGELAIEVPQVLLTGAENRIFLNQGQGQFSAEQSHRFGLESGISRGLAVGDVNGDGHFDIFVGNGFFTTAYAQTFATDDLERQVNRLYLNDGSGHFNVEDAVAIDPRSPKATMSVAMADVNQDGLLDLIAGNLSEESIIHLNRGAGEFYAGRVFCNRPPESVICFGPDSTLNVLAGDVNSDGALDLITSNASQNLIFMSDGSGNLAWSHTYSYGASNPAVGGRATEQDIGMMGLAVGDVDGDQDLDILIGHNSSGPTSHRDVPQTFHDAETAHIYLNNGQGLFTQATVDWACSELGQCDMIDAVFGDVDGDHDLDVLIAGFYTVSLFINNSEISESDSSDLTFTHHATFASEGAKSVAFGDLDSQNGLDIIIGNSERATTVYLNQGGGQYESEGRDLPNLPDWLLQSYGLDAATFNHKLIQTRDLALGDIDNDGDLDIVMANAGKPNAVYRNDGAGRFPAALVSAFGTGFDATASVLLRDMNSDGHLDVIAGNFGMQSFVYLNNGSGAFSSAFALPFGPGTGAAFDLAAGDVNGNGNADLLVGNGGSLGAVGDQLYFNPGGGLLSAVHAVIEPEEIITRTRRVALADLNNDGTPDQIAASWVGEQVAFRLLLSPKKDAPALVNNPPYITIDHPLSTDQASGYASAQVLDSPTIPITFTLFDAESDPVGAVRGYYSVNGGGAWLPALPAEEPATPFAASSTGVRHTFLWDTGASGFFGQSDNVVIRLVAQSAGQAVAQGQRYINRVAAPIQQASASATTGPFAVRGTQTRVMQDGEPVAGAMVYHRIAGQAGQATVLRDGQGNPLTTDEQGYLQGRGSIRPGDELIALWPVPTAQITTTHPSFTFTNQVSFFHTSANPNETGVDAYQVDASGVQTLTVSAQNPLLLFHLNVSLEWDARNDTLFMLELEESFQRASEILYDVTDGQAALGNINLFHSKAYWSAADVVIFADNSLRPSAAIGGLVNQPVDDPNPAIIGGKGAYLPGQIRMGTSWDPYGENVSDLGVEWTNALAHELAHYLFFLPDNYLGIDDEGRFRKVVCPGSFMTTTSDPSFSEFLTNEGWLAEAGCQTTLAHKTTQRSDWETIGEFYPMLQSPNSLNTGPSNLPFDVMSIKTFARAASQMPFVSRNFDVRTQSQERLRLPNAQSYLFKTHGTIATTDTRTNLTYLEDDQIIALGTPTGGGDRLKVRGAEVGDRLCIFDFSSPEQYSGCVDSIQYGTVAVMAAPLHPDLAPWRPEIKAHSETAYTVTVNVTLERALSDDEILMAQVYPLHYASISGNAPASVMLGYGLQFTQTYQLRLPAYEVAVRIWVETKDRRTKCQDTQHEYSCIREAIAILRLDPETWEIDNLALEELLAETDIVVYSSLFGGPDSPGFGGPDSPGFGGPDSPGFGGPDSPGFGGPDSPGFGGPDSPGFGGPDSPGFGGPDSPGFGGPDSPGFGGPDSPGFGGASSRTYAPGFGGPDSPGFGGPDSPGFGGASIRTYAPILSADAQVVVYDKIGFFGDGGVSSLDALPIVPAQETHPWLVPVGQAYRLVNSETVAERFISFNYLQRDVPDGYEHTLKIFYLHDGSDQWKVIEDSQSFVENQIVGTAQDEDGVYAVMAVIELPQLREGWNLFSYPIPVTRTITEALASIDGTYSVIYESTVVTPTVTVRQNVPILPVRQQPNMLSSVSTVLRRGDIATVLGQDQKTGWYQIACPYLAGRVDECWIPSTSTIVSYSADQPIVTEANSLLPSLTARSDVSELRPNQTYWIYINAPESGPIYLAPPTRKPSGELR